MKDFKTREAERLKEERAEGQRRIAEQRDKDELARELADEITKYIGEKQITGVDSRISQNNVSLTRLGETLTITVEEAGVYTTKRGVKSSMLATLQANLRRRRFNEDEIIDAVIDWLVAGTGKQ
jgi:hypothetical protein